MAFFQKRLDCIKDYAEGENGMYLHSSVGWAQKEAMDIVRDHNYAVRQEKGPCGHQQYAGYRNKNWKYFFCIPSKEYFGVLD